jgi:hypothetical protein
MIEFEVESAPEPLDITGMAKAAKLIDKAMRDAGLEQWARLYYGRVLYEAFLRNPEDFAFPV